MHTSFVLLIVVPALASALQAPQCDSDDHVRLTVSGTETFMTYEKAGGRIEIRTDTPEGSGSLFCRAVVSSSDGEFQGIIIVAVESDTGNKVLLHSGIENEPASVSEYQNLDGEKYTSPISQAEFFYLEPQNAKGMVLKHDVDTNEVILVPIEDNLLDPKAHWKIMPSEM